MESIFGDTPEALQQFLRKGQVLATVEKMFNSFVKVVASRKTLQNHKVVSWF